MYVTGDRELDRTLNALATKTAQKALRAGVNAGLTELGKAIRAGVNASDAPARIKREARKLVSKRFKPNRREGTATAKAGFAVGRQTKRKAAAARERSAAGQGGSKERKGVGVSASTIHWFVLGTKDRKTKKPQRATGRIAPLLDGITEDAVRKHADDIVARARKAIETTIQRSLKAKG